MSTGVHHPLPPIAPARLRPARLTGGKIEAEVTGMCGMGRFSRRQRKQLRASPRFRGAPGATRRVHIVDRHLGRALQERSVKNVWGMIRREFPRPEPGVFRRTMELDCRAHARVARARHRSCRKPRRGCDEPVGDLRRAIATGVCMAGGCGAAAGSCAGLPRTDFRRRLTLPDGRIGARTMLQALLLAHDHAAACLPVCSGMLE